MIKKSILFFGKLPPPYIGPSFATKIIIESSLKERYNLIHFDLSHHKNLSELGKISFYNVTYAFRQYYKFIKNIIKLNQCSLHSISTNNYCIFTGCSFFY